MKYNLEKELKKWLKRKVSISLATIVVFVITGSVGFAETLSDDSTGGTSIGTLEGWNNLSAYLGDVARLSKNNIFTGNNTFKGEKQDSSFGVEVKESVVTRLDKEGSKVEVEKEKKIVNQVKEGAELIMDKDASKFTKDLYVGKLVWKDTSKAKDELILGGNNKAEGYAAGAIGFNNSVQAPYSFAIGIYNQVNNESWGRHNVAIGIRNFASGTSSSAFGVGNRSHSWHSSAFGIYNIAQGEESSAFGVDNHTYNRKSSAFGAYNVATGEESSAFGGNNYAEGKKSNILGNSLFVSGENSGSFGNGAMEELAPQPRSAMPYRISRPYLYKNEGENSYTIGNYNSIAKGTENNFILGNNNIIGDVKIENNPILRNSSSIKGKADNNFIIGNKVEIKEGINNSVVLGNESTVRQATTETTGKIGNIEFGEFAGQGKEANGVVSVGAEGKERQIINVAAGKVSQDSTDAVNGSQLYSAVKRLTDTGLTFQGNDEQEVQRKLGETLTLKGEGVTKEQSATFKGAAGNINVKKSMNGVLELQLTKNLQNIERISNQGSTISLEQDKIGINQALHMGDANKQHQIKYVAEGTEDTDAVNKGQLDKAVAAVNTEVEAGKNIDVKVTRGSNGQKVYQVGLKDKITLGTDAEKAIEADGEQGTLKVGNKIIMDGKTGNANFGKVTISGEQGTVKGLTNITWDPKKITSGQAATEDQLKAVDQKIEDLGSTMGKGYTFAGDTGSVNKKLGDTVKITGDGKNITTSVTKEGDLKIELNKKIEVEQITSEKMILKNSDGSTTDVGSTLKEHSDKIEENTKSIKKGLNFAGNNGPIVNKQLGDTMSIKGKEGVSEKDVQSKYDIENVVTMTDKDGNLWIKLSKNPKFNSVEAGEGDTKVTIGNDGVKIGDKIYITKEGLNANNQKIVNVADGIIAKDSKDAVNGGQIHNIVQDINNSIHQTNHRIDKLDDKVNRGLANSAAMATLEFLEIGINQAAVGAAVGTYRGNQAVAVGVQTAPTENTRLHAKVSVAPSRSNTETMAGVGASWRFNWK